MTTPDPSLVARLQTLQQNHRWMDASTQVTLASSDTSDSELNTIADGLKQRVAQTWDGISHFFDDPVLQKAPSQSLAIKRYVQGSIGASPIATSHIADIQAQLKATVAPDLIVDGVWKANDQAALSTHAHDLYQKQLSGEKTGSVSSKGFLHSLLSSVSPSGIVDGALGFVKSIPSDIGSLAADAWGGLSGIPESIVNPGRFNSKEGQAEINKRVVDTQNTLGVNKYKRAVGLPETTYENYDPITSAVNDLGTLFLLSGGGSTVKGITGAAKATGKDGLLALSKDEALRQQRTIARSLLRPVGTRIVGGAAVGGTVGGVSAAATGQDISNGIGAGALAGAAIGAASYRGIPKKAFENLPVLKHTGPVLRNLLDNDGVYYTLRTRLAAPYQLGTVRLAGDAFAQSQAFSLKAHGVAYAEDKLGGGDISQSLDRSHVLDPINDAIGNKLQFTVLGQSFHPDLDYLMYVLHGTAAPGAPGSASKALGETFAAGTDGANAALQNVGATGQVTRAVGKSYQELVRIAGGDPAKVDDWIGNKVRQHAAYQYAEESLAAKTQELARNGKPKLTWDEQLQFKRDAASVAYHDPEVLKTSIARLMLPGEHFLETQIKNELTQSIYKPEEHLRHALNDSIDAGRILTHEVLPHADKALLTPRLIKPIPAGMDPQYATASNPFYKPVSILAPGPVEEGSLGLARLHLRADGSEDLAKSTLTSQQATRDANTFKATLEANANDPEALRDTVTDIHNYLHENYHLSPYELDVFDGQPEKLIEVLEGRAKTLAAEVHPAKDAPQSVLDALAQIRAKGYRVVHGKDIGHQFKSTQVDVSHTLGDPISRARKIVSNLGVNTEAFSRIDYGADRRLRIAQSLQAAVDDGRITLPPYYTVQTLLQDLQNDELVGKQLPWVANMMFSASRYAHKATVDRMIDAGIASDPISAEALLKSQMASAGGLRALRVQDVRKVLTRTENTPHVSRAQTVDGKVDFTVPLMDRESADEVFKAIQKGYSQTPAHMLGLQKVEDFVRYLPFKALDGHVPNNQGTLALMNLPNKIAQLRDTYRFNMSPFFSLRRVAKTNIKMGVDGVVPTLTPVKSLMQQGSYKAAHDLLDRVEGAADPRYKYLDDMDRFLNDNDIFGLYNPRHFKAYYAMQKAEQGASDAEIKEGLVHVFDYGTGAKEGRTALERSINTVFFPFSFEKTVVRNVGGYLLDKPAQALIISNALDAYRDFNNHHLDGNNPLAMSWYEQHTPLLEEALRLNAFAHGISPGELGGINRPLLNAFMPQSWASSEASHSLLTRFVPAMKDAQRILSEGTDQARIIRTSVQNGMSRIQGNSGSALKPLPSNKSQLAQRQEATQYRNDLIHSFKAVIDYNDSVTADEAKYHFGLGDNIPDDLKGQVINKTNIGYIVHEAYPVYDPLAGAAYAIQKKELINQFVARHANGPEYAKYKDFFAKAETVVGHLNRDEYPTEQAAAIQDAFRQAAIDYASSDAEFYKVYKRTLASSFGPLEGVN